MQKPTSFVSFLLMLTALLLFVGGIIISIMVYTTYAEIMRTLPQVPGAKFDPSLPYWIVGTTFTGFFVTSLVLAGLAQITESTAVSACEAEAQTEYLRQIAANATARSPSVDDVARMVASQVHVERRR